MIGIYKITSPKGKIYIGQSLYLEKRKKIYAGSRCSAQPRIYNSLKKYGWEKHKFEIITECLESELNELERYYQEIYNSIGKGGLNCTLVDAKGKRRVYSKEARIKQNNSLAKTYAAMTKEERKRKYGKALVGEKNPFYGKKHSEESRKRMSESLTGRKMSVSCIEKRTKSQTGLKRSELTKQRLSLASIGKIISESAKINMRKASRLSKVVINTENGIYYDSVIEAAPYYGLNVHSLCRRLNGIMKNKTYLKYA